MWVWEMWCEKCEWDHANVRRLCVRRYIHGLTWCDHWLERKNTNFLRWKTKIVLWISCWVGLDDVLLDYQFGENENCRANATRFTNRMTLFQFLPKMETRLIVKCYCIINEFVDWCQGIISYNFRKLLMQFVMSAFCKCNDVVSVSSQNGNSVEICLGLILSSRWSGPSSPFANRKFPTIEIV